MIIPNELAQKIVNTIMKLLHRNVNIFNREGIIIATGHPHRYNTFHKGAKEAIESGSIIEIFPDQLALYPGALQGINLPIVFDNQIIGAVGVFGHPDEVRYIGKLVKAITELILQYDLLQKEARSERSQRAKFMDFIIDAPNQNEAIPQTPHTLQHTIKTLGLSMELPRVVLLIDLKPVIEKYASEYGHSYLLHERIEKLLLNHLHESSLISEQDIALLHNTQFIFIKAMQENQTQQKLLQLGETLLQNIATSNIAQCHCGIGSIGSNITEYHISYEQALYCLQHCTPQNIVRTIYDNDILINYTLHEAIRGPSRLILNHLAKTMQQTCFIHDDMQKTLDALLENDCNIKAAAATLHIHRNTLLYRLSCLQKATGLDPAHSLYDTVLCKLILETLQN